MNDDTLDFLSKDYHGRGIMTAVIGTLIESWIIPKMRARIIRTETFVENHGSTRVFEKNGFVVEECIELKGKSNSSGVKYEGLNLLSWKR